MKIAKVSHVPIRELMFIQNGVMSQAWVMFFERLAKGIDVSDFVDEIEIAQRSHELPSMALQGQMMLDNHLSDLPMVAVPSVHFNHLDLVAVPSGEVL